METRSDASLRKELDELRELFKQAQDQAKIAQDLAQRQSELVKATIDDLELALRVAPLPSLTSPVPNTNLMPTITGAVPIDEQRLNDALSAISREFDGRLNILTQDANAREDRLMQHITALIGSNVGNILPVVPVPTGPQNLSFNMTASTTSQPTTLAASTANVQPPTVLPINDYDKSVEVEQRKLINPETTPNSIRLWLISFETYSKHPNKLLTMTEAFGEKALMNLHFMFPDDHIPNDEPGFRDFLNRHFLMTKSLFSDIKAATYKVAMKSLSIVPLTLDSLHTYLAAFCTALIPFKDDLITQAADMDCQKTLIKSFSEGLPKPFRDILEETSCSTWSSLQKRFQECLTPTNVQLAMARHQQWKQGLKGGTVSQGESIKETSSNNTYGLREGKRAASAKTATVSSKPNHKKSEPIKSDLSTRPKYCKNCRSDLHETLQCQLRTCYNCRDKGEHCIHLQSECKQRVQRENYIESVTQAAGKAAAAKAMQEVYLFYNDEDEDEYSDFSTEAP